MNALYRYDCMYAAGPTGTENRVSEFYDQYQGQDKIHNRNVQHFPTLVFHLQSIYI